MFQKIKDTLFLRKQKRFLLREQKRIKEQLLVLKKFPDYGTSDEAHTQEVEEYESNLSLEVSLKNLSQDIEKALQRIEKGKYEECTKCKGPIERGRLDAYPSAILCVSCSSQVKKGR